MCFSRFQSTTKLEPCDVIKWCLNEYLIVHLAAAAASVAAALVAIVGITSTALRQPLPLLRRNEIETWIQFRLTEAQADAEGEGELDTADFLLK